MSLIFFSGIIGGTRGANNQIIINTESDFPNQDATTITLDEDTGYFLGSIVTTAKRFIIQNGVSLSSINIFSVNLIYTGSGIMFTSSGVQWELKSIAFSCVNGTVFNMTGPFNFFMSESSCSECLNIGTIDGGVGGNSAFGIDASAFLSVTGQGFQFSNDFFRVFLSPLTITMTSATGIAVDLGTCTIITFTAGDYVASGPVGSLALKGEALSANIAAGQIASVRGGTLGVGGMTALSGIEVSDIRWDFDAVSNVTDSVTDILLVFDDNALETTIDAINTPVLIDAVWSIEKVSRFTGTAAGRATYEKERPADIKIDLSCGVLSAGGSAVTMTLYLALDGTIIDPTGFSVEVSGNSPRTFTIPWISELIFGNFIEIFIENNSNTNNLIVTDAKLRLVNG